MTWIYSFDFNNATIPCTYDDTNQFNIEAPDINNKKMIMYYLMYNYTLEPNAFFLGPEFPATKDPTLVKVLNVFISSST